MSWACHASSAARLVAAGLVLAALSLGATEDARVAAATREPLILYASDWTGHMEIYAFDPARQRTVGQLSFGTDTACPEGLLPGGFIDPVPSPDGRHLLYGCANRTPPAFWVARADGRSRRRLADPALRSVYDAAWSPDSKRIVYSAADGLHVVRSDGSGDRRISPAAWAAPRWAPDGKSLAALSGTDLHLLRAGRVRLLRRDAGLALVFSPDGRWIATWFPHGRREVRVTSVSGKPGPAVGRGVLAAWSPDGRRLAYEAPDGLRVLDLRTRRQSLLTRETAYGSRDYDERSAGLAWAPDGRSITYVAGSLDVDDGVQSGDLRSVTLAGRTRTIVGANRRYGGRMLSPAWTRRAAGLRYRSPQAAPATRVAADGVLAVGPISRLVGGGARVAFVSCLGVYAWSPATRALAAVHVASWPGHRGPATCYRPDRTSVYSLAVAGDRIAYGERIGCTGTVTLRMRRLAPGGSTVELARSNVTCAAPMRPALGDLEGSAGLLVYGAATEEAACCPLGPITTAVQVIGRVGADGCPCPSIGSSPGPYVPADVDRGRVVAYGRNETRILDGEGAQLLSIPVSPLAAQLAGDDLVVLLRGELRVYDAERGALRRSWPLADVASGGPCDLRCAAARLVLHDAARGLATYVLDGKVHVLRLADGADSVVAAGTLAAFVDAGLVYADGSRLHLVPFARLPTG